MAIFGKAEMKYYNEILDLYQYPVLRDGNNWDVFLNYFFAILFIFCFLIGIFLNPFIIAYHSKQKKTFATFLFLLVSVIDQLKSLYFPLVLVPKLLSPLSENDYYYIMPVRDLSSIHWTAYSNKLMLSLNHFEMLLLVVPCVSRYLGLVRPLSSAKKRNLVFSAVLVFLFLYCFLKHVPDYFQQSFFYMRITDLVYVADIPYNTNYDYPMIYINGGLTCLFMLLGGSFIVLTIGHLKNSDTASSTASSRNIRRGIISLIAMNIFNVFVLLSAVGFNIANRLIEQSEWRHHSTSLDFIQFGEIYGTPLIQSAFNSLSFLFICSAFRAFVKKLVYQDIVGPNTGLVTHVTEQNTTAM